MPNHRKSRVRLSDSVRLSRMTASSPTSPERIDASCRLPLFVLFGGAAFWLVLSSLFGLAASLTFHKPDMFADCTVFNYGRAYPAWSNLLVYGFCIPAGLGVGLWLLARLGRVEVAKPWLLAVGAKIWHFGVLVGWVAIMAGQTSGQEWLEVPPYVLVILFLGLMVMVIWKFVTHTQRHEESLYPSQWFVIAALFWLPWILSTVILLAQWFPLHGVMQAVVAWWYGGNLINVWLSFAGVASAFYFLPKLTGRPLNSYYLALFVFWTLMIFGTWTGIPAHAPLPSWMPQLSGIAKLLAFLPALAALMIMFMTCRGAKTEGRGGPLCYAKIGIWSLVVSSLLLALTACPQISLVTDFTWFGHGQNLLRLYGFFAMTMFGAIYYILPRLIGQESLNPGRVRLHFWLGVAGVALFALPLIGGGVMQGLKLLDPSIEFLKVAKSTLMPFRMSTLGEVLLLGGNVIFFINVTGVIVGHYRKLGKAAYTEATAKLQTAGAKS
jgi:cytochrome c oxidase cbb3-type subunit 1